MSGHDSAANDVLKCEAARYDAQIRQDESALRNLLDDELHYTHSTGAVDTKESFLKFIKTVHYKAVDRDEVTVRVYDQFATVTGIAKMTVDRSRQIRQSRIRFVNVWIDRGAGWKNLIWQSTPLSN